MSIRRVDLQKAMWDFYIGNYDALFQRFTVETAGDAVQITYPANRSVWAVKIKALPNNTGIIYLKEESDDGNTTNAYSLPANNDIGLPCNEDTSLWIDASVNNQGVEVIFFARRV